MKPSARHPADRAFTLVELVSSMSVITILMVVTSRLILGASDQYLSAVSRAELSQEMSCAMERLTTELRGVRLRDKGVPDLTSVTATSVSWSDAAGSKSISLDGTELRWTDSVGSAPLARGVTAFAVQTFDDAGLPLPSVPNAAQLRTVRRIQITLSAHRQGVDEVLRTRVFLRRLASGGGV
jgi:prepilin-type N-terminal cleavage/methylation domain-containing protein